MKKLYRNYSEELKDVTEISAHGLRHSYASHLFYENVDLQIISMYLGHSAISTTERYYIHFSEANYEINRTMITAKNDLKFYLSKELQKERELEKTTIELIDKLVDDLTDNELQIYSSNHELLLDKINNLIDA